MDAPHNPELIRGISEVLDARPDAMEKHLRALLEALLRATVIAAGDEDKPSTCAADGGGKMLALFTDLIELHRFAARSRWVSMRAEDAIRRVAAGEFDGLVINPRGRALPLSQRDVRELFDVPAGRR